ncbi:MAG: uroporphyrinogen-III synthase, partial [Pseudomonadota bacterium]
SPVLSIVPEPEPDFNVSGVTGVVFSSRNAITVVSGWTCLDALRAKPAFCVGPKTASLARDAGFDVVGDVAATAVELADVLIRHCKLGEGNGDQNSLSNHRIVQFAGANVAADLVGRIRAAGYGAEKVVVYRAEAARDLTDEARIALTDECINAVVLYSPRSAKVFRELIDTTELGDKLNGVSLLCLSANVAAELEHVGEMAARVAVAEKPNGKEMLALIDR